MEGNGGSSSTMVEPTGVKPVIVRVKRKIAHSCLDAFWLEINERPSKRALVDLAKLSLSDSAGKEELKSKKVFVHHVKTVTTSEASIEIAFPYTADKIGSKTRVQERRDAFKKDNRQDQLSKSRQKQVELAKIARFQQVWRSRKGRKDCVDYAYHFYDVVRVDVARRSNNVQIQDTMSLEDRKLLSSYLPLLEEYIPGAAEEIENDLQSYISEKDEFVYDYYMVKDNTYMDEDDTVSPFPLVQVDDEDFYDVPSESEIDSEDSNAENNPLNDYPEEESDDDEEEEEEEEDDDDDDEEESEVSDESEDEIEKSLEDDRFRNIRSMEDQPPVIYEPEDSYGDDYWVSDYCGDDNEAGYDDGDDGEW